ncbi:alpha/beta hydrolase [Sphingosinicella ginsenosidimutans]
MGNEDVKQIKTQKVHFSVRKATIKASVTKPKTVIGGVVLLHGLCVDRDEFDGFYLDLAEALARAGLVSVRFDFAGHGVRRKEWREFSIVQQYVETCAAIAWLAETYELQPARVRLVGTSFGAPPAIFSAYKRADLVDRIALISPVLDYQATFIDPICSWGRENFGPEALAKASDTGGLVIDGKHHLPTRLFDEMELIDPLDRLSMVRAKTLIIHGSTDSMVPVGPAREAAKNKGVKLMEERQMDHGPFHVDDADGDSPASVALRDKVIGSVTSHLAEGL